MKLHVEIEVDDKDLDAVAFALNLTPSEGEHRIDEGRDNAKVIIKRRMRQAADVTIGGARQLLTLKESIFGTQA